MRKKKIGSNKEINTRKILKFTRARIYFVFLFWAFTSLVHPAGAQEHTPPSTKGSSTVTVNKIFIVGYEQKRSTVILREMYIAEGDTYTWNQFIDMEH